MIASCEEVIVYHELNCCSIVDVLLGLSHEVIFSLILRVVPCAVEDAESPFSLGLGDFLIFVLSCLIVSISQVDDLYSLTLRGRLL